MSKIILTTKGKWIIGIVLALLVSGFGVIPILALVRYSTMSAQYCKTCHLKEFEEWQSSQGHSKEDASCTDCHALAAEMVPKNYSADHDTMDQKCIRCHSTIKTLEQEGLKKHIIKISHKVHVGDSEIGCLECHRNLVHDQEDPPTHKVTKRSCYGCHQDTIEGPSNEENCLKCHYMILAYEAE
jgi:hypothetical protein